jgi:uncharacterized membrane protein YjgN (DUF898 family)
MSAITADDDSVPGLREHIGDGPRSSSSSSSPARSATDGSAGSRGHELPVRFTASGSEYFRIWIVNLLLTVLTLGLYLPWAKVRKRRYFYGNTWIGDHAFDFHGKPRKMLRGTLLVGLLFMAYSAADRFSVTAGLVALLFVGCVAPALFLSSLRFRTANTSWRGMRFHFEGDLPGAYKALLPGLLIFLSFSGLTLLLPQPGHEKDVQDAVTRPEWLGAAMMSLVLLGIVLLPFIMWSIKRYQQGHYALGRVRTQLRTGAGSFYAVFGKTLGVILLVFVAAGLVVVLLFGVGAGSFDVKSWGMKAIGAMILLIFAGYFAGFLILKTFLVSRLQNLVWTRTKSSEVRFESRLRLGPLFRLTLKNMLLVMCTLGLYWPFAAVALARLKLQSVTVFTRRPVDELIGRAGSSAGDAAGDAAGDLFGLDVGL